MCRFVFVACLVGLVGYGGSALAQGEGPLLAPPGENRPQFQPEGPRGNALPRIEQRFDDRNNLDARRTALPDDPEIRQIAIWYQSLFNRELRPSEARNWQTYLEQDTGSLKHIPSLLLGSEEFFEQSGGRYETWLARVGQAIGQKVTERDLQRWSGEYQRHRDRVAFTNEFLAAQGRVEIQDMPVRTAGYQPAPRPEDAGRFEDYLRDGGYRSAGGFDGGRYYEDRGYGPDPWQLSPFSPYGGGGMQPPTPGYYNGYGSNGYGHDDHDHGRGPINNYEGGSYYGSGSYGPVDPHAGHEHGQGAGRPGARPPIVGQPVARTEAELIAGWYRTYFGRNIVQWELRKWLTDLEKGMPLGEVFASVLASKEWYDRNGGDPRRWVAATLAALGQRDPAAVGPWLNRYGEMNRDRMELAKALVSRFGVQPQGPVVSGAIGGHGHAHDDHDHHDEDDDRRERRRRDRFDDDD